MATLTEGPGSAVPGTSNGVKLGPNAPNSGVQVLPFDVSVSDVGYWVAGLLVLAFIGWQLSIHTSSGHTFLFIIVLLIALINVDRLVGIANNIGKAGGLP